MVKYIITTGGVISGVGKGIITSSLGLLLKTCQQKITIIKIDPYVNVDAGTINPLDHGEVFVLQDGSEVDLDLGNYERFLDTNLTRDNCITTGKVYKKVIENERKGDYLGKTVQVIPHVTNVILDMITSVSKDVDVCLIEVGGTVGDIESLPFLEALRQLRFKVGHENFNLLHVSLVPCVNNEQKSKPTQSSVKTLGSLGLNPDLILCRSQDILDETIREKVSMFCNIPLKSVLSVMDCKTIYQVPKLLTNQGILDLLGFSKDKNNFDCNNFDYWDTFVDNVLDKSRKSIKIGIFGKYIVNKNSGGNDNIGNGGNDDAYISLKKAIEHACFYLNVTPDIHFIDCSSIKHKSELDNYFLQFNGIIVPGGFGTRGTNDKIDIIQNARRLKIPFIGICLGFQLAVIEFANNVCKMDTSSDEFIAKKDNIIIDIPEHKSESMGGTMKLGNYTTCISKNTLAFDVYQQDEIVERHRHRFEVDTKWNELLQNNGMIFSGTQKENGRMHILELDKALHPFFIATQFHPEFKTRPLKPTPLFVKFIESCNKK